MITNLFSCLLALFALSSGAGESSSDATPEDSMETRCRNEVLDLHRFFRDWFCGVLEAEGFRRFEDVMADGFVIVTPQGGLRGLAELSDGLRRAHGGWKGEGRIWIENFRLHRVEGDVAVVTYEEWQDVRGEVKGRLSTALFRQREGTPNGVEWLHVHEVWLPKELQDGEVAADDSDT